MKKIYCKGFLLNRLVIAVLFGGLLIEVPSLMFLFKIDIANLIPILSMVNFLLIVFIFYLNRNEVYTISIQGDEVSVDFFNKVFFKRVPMDFRKGEFKIERIGAKLSVYNGEKCIMHIREQSMKPDEWRTLIEFFAN